MYLFVVTTINVGVFPAILTHLFPQLKAVVNHFDSRSNAIEEKLDRLIELLDANDSPPARARKRPRIDRQKSPISTSEIVPPSPSSSEASRNHSPGTTPNRLRYRSRARESPPDIPKDVGSLSPSVAFSRWHKECWYKVRSNKTNSSRMNTCRMAMAYYLLFLDNPPPQLPPGVMNSDDPSDEANKWRECFDRLVRDGWKKIVRFFMSISVPEHQINTVAKFKNHMFKSVQNPAMQWPHGPSELHMNNYLSFYGQGNKNSLKNRAALLRNKIKANQQSEKMALRRQEDDEAERLLENRAALITQDEERESAALQADACEDAGEDAG